MSSSTVILATTLPSSLPKNTALCCVHINSAALTPLLFDQSSESPQSTKKNRAKPSMWPCFPPRLPKTLPLSRDGFYPRDQQTDQKITSWLARFWGSKTTKKTLPCQLVGSAPLDLKALWKGGMIERPSQAYNSSKCSATFLYDPRSILKRFHNRRMSFRTGVRVVKNALGALACEQVCQQAS